MNIDSEIYDAVKQNALVFLNKGIRELASHNDTEDTPLDIELATISVALLQISFELALNAYAIKKSGVRTILRTREATRTDEEIRELFQSNELPTKNFNVLLEELQSSSNLFDDDAIYHIRLFQTTRNKLVHLHCNLHEADRYDFKYELIYFITHILIWLISSSDDLWTTSLILESHLDNTAYKKLVSFSPYINEMEKLAKRDSESVFNCCFCNKKTFAEEMKLCYACNYDYSDQEFTNCGRCGAEDSVIYDHLNLESNDNEARGLCLNCDTDDIYFRCPECETVYGLEANIGNVICSRGQCQYLT